MKRYEGITLIALVITVIVMLILAGVALSAISGDAGLFGRVQKTAELYNNQSKNEADEFNQLLDGLDQYFNGNENTNANTSTTPEPEEPKQKNKVTVSGQTDKDTEALTKENLKDYLGRVVTNFKTGNETTETIEIGDEETEKTQYTVSTKYRLYYVDFDGKYGEENTIYLKADQPGSDDEYEIPITEQSAIEDNADVKIKDLNPGLYYEEAGEGIPLPNKEKLRDSQKRPSLGQDNMKAVTWLTNTKNWESLINNNNVNSKIKNSINYIVGAPSLEMMVDSYNTYYSGKGKFDINKSLDTEFYDGGDLENDTDKRAKLFYLYPNIYSDDYRYYGYGVGPTDDMDKEKMILDCTKHGTVKPDQDVGSMYCPGNNQGYWLASPSAPGYAIARRRWLYC